MDKLIVGESLGVISFSGGKGKGTATGELSGRAYRNRLASINVQTRKK